jgi:hypothetical protein
MPSIHEGIDENYEYLSLSKQKFNLKELLEVFCDLSSDTLLKQASDVFSFELTLNFCDF